VEPVSWMWTSETPSPPDPPKYSRLSTLIAVMSLLPDRTGLRRHGPDGRAGRGRKPG
jgi:hypothetical protein